MEEQNQQGLNLSEDKIFGRIGKLVMINEELSEMLSKSQKKLQEVVEENENLRKEVDSAGFCGGNDSSKTISDN